MLSTQKSLLFTELKTEEAAVVCGGGTATIVYIDGKIESTPEHEVLTVGKPSLSSRDTVDQTNQSSRDEYWAGLSITPRWFRTNNFMRRL